MNDKNQSGRSMIEMLGVLAIIGVLSVGGIAGYSKAMMTMKINKTIEQISHMASAIKTAYMNQSGNIDKNGDPVGKYYDMTSATAIAIGAVPTEMVNGNSLKNVFGGNVIVDGECADGPKEEAYHLGGAFTLRYENLPKEACIALVTRDWNGIFQAIDFGNQDGSSVPDYVLLLSDVLVACKEENQLPDWLVTEEGSGLGAIGCNKEPFYISPADAALGCTCEENKCMVAFVTND